jgi:hypothetical protein
MSSFSGNFFVFGYVDLGNRQKNKAFFLNPKKGRKRDLAKIKKLKTDTEE